MPLTDNILTINGVSSADYGLYLNSDTWLNSPEIAREAYQIPYRTGDLVRDEKRMNNIPRTFELFTKGANAQQNVERFRKAIYTHPFGYGKRIQQKGYSRIVTSYDPNFHCFGYLVGEIEVEPFQSGDALSLKVTMTFSCDPRKHYDINSRSTSITFLTGIEGVVNRGSNTMRQILSGNNAEFEKIADYFVLRYLGTGNIGYSEASYSYTIDITDDHRPFFLAIAYRKDGVFQLANADDLSLYGTVPYRTRNVSGADWFLIFQAASVGTIDFRVSGQGGYFELDSETVTFSNPNAVGYYPSIDAYYYLRNTTLPTSTSLIMLEGVSSTGLEMDVYEPEVTTFRKYMILRWDLMPSSVLSYVYNNARKHDVDVTGTTFSCIRVMWQNALYGEDVYCELMSGQKFDLSPYAESYGEDGGPADQLRVTTISPGPTSSFADGLTHQGGLAAPEYGLGWWKV